MSPAPRLFPACLACPASIPSLYLRYFCVFTLSALLKMKPSLFHLILPDKPFVPSHRERPICPPERQASMLPPSDAGFHHQSCFPLVPALLIVPVVPVDCPFLSPIGLPHVSFSSSKAASSLPSFLLSSFLLSSFFKTFNQYLFYPSICQGCMGKQNSSWCLWSSRRILKSYYVRLKG